MIDENIKLSSNLSNQIESTLESLKIIKRINPDEKIKKYDALIIKSKELLSEVNILSERKINQDQSRDSLFQKLDDETVTLEKMKLFLETHEDTRLEKIQKNIEIVSNKIVEKEKFQHSLIEKIAHCKVKVENLNQDRERHEEIKCQMRVYDLFTQAVSKKGIPTHIMMSRLPIINSEISSVLQGVVDFTVSLETDPNTNSLEVYIDYGDSKRVIELASGMEKMISSLAIRVALINTSSLTKTNMMIIDEGFGSLDANNLEACTRLLESLKKWFRNILVISHVDAVKDCVDNSIEITKKAKDSHVYFV